jgi:hypothetical protein
VRITGALLPHSSVQEGEASCQSRYLDRTQNPCGLLGRTHGSSKTTFRLCHYSSAIYGHEDARSQDFAVQTSVSKWGCDRCSRPSSPGAAARGRGSRTGRSVVVILEGLLVFFHELCAQKLTELPSVLPRDGRSSRQSAFSGFPCMMCATRQLSPAFTTYS